MSRQATAAVVGGVGIVLLAAALLILLSGCTPITTTHQTDVSEPLNTSGPGADVKPTPGSIYIPAPEPTAIVTYSGVRAGAYCSERGALGTTSTGEVVRCTNSTTDPSYRWRKLQGE